MVNDMNALASPDQSGKSVIRSAQIRTFIQHREQNIDYFFTCSMESYFVKTFQSKPYNHSDFGLMPIIWKWSLHTSKAHIIAYAGWIFIWPRKTPIWRSWSLFGKKLSATNHQNATSVDAVDLRIGENTIDVSTTYNFGNSQGSLQGSPWRCWIDGMYLILGVLFPGYPLTSWQLYNLDTGLDQDAAICLSTHWTQSLVSPWKQLALTGSRLRWAWP